jgi:3-deoxy-D-manno-octulosonic-acid transferase
MSFILDCIYVALLVVGMPFILTKRKLRRGLWVRLRAALAGRRIEIDPGRGVILVHCVSVGEVAAAVSLIEALEHSCPQYQVVVSTTTPQGMETAKKRLPGRALTYFPFDFSFSVARFLDRLAPGLVVLMELEAWPNFLRAAGLRRIPVVLANGRLTELSLRRYMKMSFFARDVFSRIDHYLVQSEEYRERFMRLGVPDEKIVVSGNIKYDSVRLKADEEKVSQFRKLFGIKHGDEVILGGSTYALEEEALAGIYQKLKGSHPRLRLILAPRQLDRLSEVKSIMEKAGIKYALRSELEAGTPGDIEERAIVLDTVGELADAYALGTVVFVGGSLIDRGGHNMVEPAALGVPTLFGPNTYHFNLSTRFLLDARAAVMVKDTHELEETVRLLLDNPQMREKMGENAQKAVLNEKGAVDKHIAEISRILL